jgi:hypothetical protein
MKFYAKWRIFPKVAAGILFLFLGVMVYVTSTAYARRSGHTGLDMAKVQLMRAKQSSQGR